MMYYGLHVYVIICIGDFYFIFDQEKELGQWNQIMYGAVLNMEMTGQPLYHHSLNAKACARKPPIVQESVTATEQE